MAPKKPMSSTNGAKERGLRSAWSTASGILPCTDAPLSESSLLCSSILRSARGGLLAGYRAPQDAGLGCLSARVLLRPRDYIAMGERLSFVALRILGFFARRAMSTFGLAASAVLVVFHIVDQAL